MMLKNSATDVFISNSKTSPMFETKINLVLEKFHYSLESDIYIYLIRPGTY